MFRLATSNMSVRARKRSRSGSALIITLVVMVSLVGLLFAASSMSTIEMKSSRRMVNEVRSDYLAQAGIERGINFLTAAVANTGLTDPLSGLTNMFGGGSTYTPFVGTPLLNGTDRVGAYSVTFTNVAQTPTSITIAIDATGYLPDAPQNLAPGQQVSSWHAVRSTVRYSLAPSKVFDYGYFINNWGWFYGNTINCNGNARSNGQFDAAGYAPTMTGQPLYDAVSLGRRRNADLSATTTTTATALSDGNDGGICVRLGHRRGSQNVHGNGGHAENQHDFQTGGADAEPVRPRALRGARDRAGGAITIGGVPVSNAVSATRPARRGTCTWSARAANPIVIHGPVVVRGDVIISGVVTGQGAIYAGGNIYVPNSSPTRTRRPRPRPADNTQAATESVAHREQRTRTSWACSRARTSSSATSPTRPGATTSARGWATR